MKLDDSSFIINVKCIFGILTDEYKNKHVANHLVLFNMDNKKKKIIFEIDEWDNSINHTLDYLKSFWNIEIK